MYAQYTCNGLRHPKSGPCPWLYIGGTPSDANRTGPSMTGVEEMRLPDLGRRPARPLAAAESKDFELATGFGNRPGRRGSGSVDPASRIGSGIRALRGERVDRSRTRSRAIPSRCGAWPPNLLVHSDEVPAAVRSVGRVLLGPWPTPDGRNRCRYAAWLPRKLEHRRAHGGKSGAELSLGIGIVVGDVRPGMGLDDAKVGQQQGQRFGLHGRAAVGVDGELAGHDVLLAAGMLD